MQGIRVRRDTRSDGTHVDLLIRISSVVEVRRGRWVAGIVGE
jgi:hypothetical protein